MLAVITRDADSDPGSLGQPVAVEDRVLAKAAARGDDQALAALAERLLNRVRATASYLTRSESDADDLVQNAMVQILRSVDRYRGEGSLEAWADRITVRASMRWLRHRSRQAEVPASDEDSAGLLEREPGCGEREPELSLEQEAQRRQVHLRMAHLLQRLKPERRVAVVLRWVHGYTIQEIADLTDVRLNTARGRLRTGKKELRRLVLRDPMLKRWEALLTP
jgi:RNA polymerase sigma-70 factor (ECF subfamily)